MVPHLVAIFTQNWYYSEPSGGDFPKFWAILKSNGPMKKRTADLDSRKGLT
jgi:hypothetical protein